MLRRYGWPAAVVRKLAAVRRPTPRRRRPVLGWEPLEDRTTPAVYTVTNTNNSGAGSFRQAIIDANSTGAADTIEFNIPGAGVHTITPTTPLPAINDSIHIKGASQPGYTGTPLIALSGATAGGSGYGLQVAGVEGAGSVIRGLAIYGWTLDANIRIASNSVGVYSCYIGIDPSANAGSVDNTGIRVDVGSNVQIGDTGAGAGNVIADTGNYGVLITSGADTVWVVNNRIGVHPTNDTALGVQPSRAVTINGSVNNTIGGASAGSRNVLDNYNQYGVEITGAGASGNVVAGNAIGAVAGGGVAGVQITSAPNNTVGGTAAGAGNVISDNTFGVAIQFSGANNNAVIGNRFGTNAAGTPTVGKENATGVLVGNSATGTVVGQPGAGNRIYNSPSNGVLITSDGNTVAANEIRASGAAGVRVSGASNTVGGTAPLSGNAIVGGVYGVRLTGSGASSNIVRGNLIGVEASGAAAGNLGDGVRVDNGATGNVIGGVAGYGQQVIYPGTDFEAGKVAVEAAGTVLVVRGALLERYDPSDGGTATLTSLGAPQSFEDLAVYHAGTIVALTYSPATTTHRVIEINRFNGAQTVLASGGVLASPDSAGIALENAVDGLKVIVADRAGGGRVVRIDPVANTQTVISSGGELNASLVDVAVGYDSVGDPFYVTTDAQGKVVRVTPAGVQTVVSAGGGPFDGPNVVTSIESYGDGYLLTAADGGGTAGGLYAVNAGGGLTPLATGSAVNSALGVTPVAGGDFLVGGLDVGGLVRVTANAARNVIGNNSESGVRIDGATTTGNAVQGNYIGTAPSGQAAAPNGPDATLDQAGVWLSAPGNTVGGASPDLGNLISGNYGDAGVLIQGDNSTVTFNRIGSDVTGLNALGNQQNGIDVQSANSVIRLNMVVASGNVGIAFQSLVAANNTVAGNYIGVSYSFTPLPNVNAGVELFSDGGNNTIGGTAAGDRNYIAGNTGPGVKIRSTNNFVLGNYIGTDADGTASIPNTVGVLVEAGGDDNFIGGTEPGAGNLISGNSADGVVIDGAGTTGNLVEGNLIGTTPTGLAALPNDGNGVVIGGGATGNAVGGAGGFGQRPILSTAGADIIAREPAGTVLLTDGQNLTRYDPATGLYSFVTSVAGLDVIHDLAVTAAGAVYALVRVDVGYELRSVAPSNGAMTVISSTGVFADTGASGIAVDAGGHVIVASVSGGGRVVRVDPGTADQTVVSTGGELGGVEAIAVDPLDGSYLTLRGVGKIVRVTPGGSQTVVRAAGGVFTGPVSATGLTPLYGGVILVTAYDGSGGGSDGGVYGVDPTNGNTVPYVTGAFVNRSFELVRQESGNWLVTSSVGLVRAGFNAAMNVIGGNAGGGLTITGTGTAGNTVDGNYVGINLDGTAAVPNGSYGIAIEQGASGNVVGSLASSGAVNVVSGNTSFGVIVQDSGTNNNVIAGARIGTNAAGTAAVPNDVGVDIAGGAAGTTVGGTTSLAGNLISGNTGDGISVLDAGTDGTAILGNQIGTTWDGLAALPNGNSGVSVFRDASNTTIGGGTAAARNVISGNTNDGVSVFDGATGTLVVGNYLGTNASGSAALPNGTSGVSVFRGAPNTAIGGSGAGEGNLISGNAVAGVSIFDGTSGVSVRGNRIGTNAAGTAAVPNSSGVEIANGAAGTVIGTDGDGVNDGFEGNLISGNTFYGVVIGGANNNRVAGNQIGTDYSGLSAIPNVDGVAIFGATGNVVGTDGSNDAFNAAERNVISGNSDRGIILEGANVAAGNWIGLGAAGIILSNQFGIQVTEAGGRVGTNADGVADADERNVISGNLGSGIIVRNNTTTGAVIAGNYIGTDPAGTQARPNGNNGVHISLGARGTTVGGTAAAARNVISGNAEDGVLVDTFTGPRGLAQWWRAEGDAADFYSDNPGSLNNGATYAAGHVGRAFSFTQASNSHADFGPRVFGTADFSVGFWVNTTQTQATLLGNRADFGTGNYFSLRLNASGRLVAEVDDGGTNYTVAGGTAVVTDGAFHHVAVVRAGAILRVYVDGVLDASAIGPGVANVTTANPFIAGWEPLTGFPALTGLMDEIQIYDRALPASDVADIVAAGSNGVGGNRVQGNFIGTNAAGTGAVGNNGGVVVGGGATNALVGGTAAGAGNVISGNARGVVIGGGATTGNTVAGNYIGTDATGLADLGNALEGIRVHNGSGGNTIGGAVSGARNVIAGNGAQGVFVFQAGAGNTVAGNTIGLAADGSTVVGNDQDGISLADTDGTTVGGTVAAARNVIGGNAFEGLLINFGSDNTVVVGNYVGTDATGTLARGNGNSGVLIANGSTNATIGGTTAAERNVISGNSFNGNVAIRGAGGNTVSGNYIGTNAAGTAAVGGHRGVLIDGASTGNTVGGTAAGAGNLISGNGGAGVEVDGAGADGNTIAGNLIGTDAAGTAAVGNGGDGVRVSGGAANTLIGGSSNLLVINNGSGAGLSRFAADTGVLLDEDTAGISGGYDLAFGPDGNLYIANRGTNTVTRHDPQTGALLGTFIPAGSGGLNSPTKLLFTPSGHLLVSSVYGNEVLRYNATTGAFVDVFLSGNGLNRPSGMVVGPDGRLYVASDGSNEVKRYDLTTGAYLGNFASGGGLSGPDGIAFGPDGHLYVTSYYNDAILRYNGATGAYLDTFVSGGPVNGPTDVQFDPDGNLYVVNYDGGSVSRFSPSGQYLGDVLSAGPGLNSPVRVLITATARNVISGNTRAGVHVNGTGTTGTSIRGNYIGTDATGAAGLGNGYVGVYVETAGSTTVGGGAAGARNVVSGGGNGGVYVFGSPGTRVQGNSVGVTAGGKAALPNAGSAAVTVHASPNTVIGVDGDGADDAGEGNVVVGNGATAGVHIVEGSGGTVVAGNLVGLNAAGTAALGGGSISLSNFEGDGIRIGTNADGVSDALERNIVADGLSVGGNGVGPSSHVIAGNYFGTDATGLVGLGSGSIVLSHGAHGVRFGTNADGVRDDVERNVVAAMDLGLFVYGDNNTVAGNYIGLGADGATALPIRSTQFGGVTITGFFGATGNVVGGTAAAARNVIGSNAGYGVGILEAGATGNTVAGNYIGTDKTGTLARPNAVGVKVDLGATGNTVGGTAAGAGNVVAHGVVGIQVLGTNNTVAGNLATDNGTGIQVSGSANLIGGNSYPEGNRVYASGVDGVHLTGGASGNTVSHNSLGTGYTLAAAGQGSNTRHGLYLDGGANNNLVTFNVSGANYGDGISLDGAGTTGNVLSDNLIGLDTTGGGVFNIGNGVAIVGGAAANTLRGNTISNSLENGVFISGDGTDGNVVRGNKIGTNVAGTDGGTALGLSNDVGVYVAFGAAGNVVGGTFAADRNIISGNTVAGVRVYGAGTADNVVSGNYIGTTVFGEAPLANAIGVRVDGGAAGTVVGSPTTAGAVNWLVADAAAGAVRQFVGPQAAGRDTPITGAAGAHDAAYGPDGNLYVASRSAGILRYDGRTGAPLGVFAATGANGLVDPLALQFTPEGELLVANFGAAGILRYNASTGAFLGAFPATAFTLGLLIGPDGLLYATNYFGAAVSVYQYQTGARLRMIAAPVGEPGGMAFGPDGALYVAGYTTSTVARIDTATNTATTFISGGALNGSMDIKFGPDGKLYVANYTDGSIARYTAAGSFVDYYVAPGGLTNPARLLAARGGGNVISGNTGNGVLVNGFGTAGTAITGNIIGLYAAGAGVLANGGDGIEVSSAGTTTIRGNTIAANVGANVSLGGNGALAGTASWWPAEGSPNDLVGTNHLTPMNGAGFAPAGGGTQAFSFDGVDDYYRAPYDPSFNPADAVSVEAWVRPTSMPAVWADVVNQFFDGSTFGAGSYALRLYADGSVAFGVGTTVASPDLYWYVRSAPGLVTPGTFAHLAGTYDAATGVLAVYVNGWRYAGTATGTLLQTQTALKIGADLFNSRYFHGLIDEPAVYTRALSANEVETICSLDRTAKGGHTVAGNKIGTNAAGSSGVGGGTGVDITDSAGNTIGGYGATDANVISGHGGDGVSLFGDGATRNAVFNNVIGLNAARTAEIGNRVGVAVAGGASANTIGDEGSGNWISGNREAGVVVIGLGTDGNTILGNLIGLGDSGVPLGNDGEGVGVGYGPTNTVVGGTHPYAGNVIGANGGHGVFVGADGTAVLGNFIGTDKSQTLAVGNAGDGVSIEAADVAVGGVAAGEANTIAHNLGAGVVVVDLGPTAAGGPRGGNAVRGNTIYQNVGLGIDLGGEDGPDGFTPNDPGDADTGPNARLNFPVLTGASIIAGQLVVSGIARPGAVLDLYAADLTRYGPDADEANPFGQGRTYLGTATVPAGAAAGYGPKAVNGTYLGADAATGFSLALPLPAGFAPGTPVVATATTPEGTSEFGNNATAQVPTLTASLDPPAIDEGATAVLRGAFPTVDPAHAHTVRVDWGDGSAETRPVTPGSATFELPHTYRDNPAGAPVGAFPVLITVTDTETGFAQTTATAVTVANVAPRVRVVSAQGAAATGATVVLAAEVTDPGADAFTYAWVVTQNGTVVGSAAGPTLTFTRDPSLPSVVTLTVADDDGGFGADTATVFSLTPNSDVKQVTPADVLAGADRVVVVALGGNDVVTVRADVAVPVVIDGGDGDDAITGGPGDDVLTGGTGDDSIDGGGGDDTFEQAPGSSDTLAGGGGNDTLSFKTAAQGTNGLGITFSLADTARQAVLTTGTGTHYLQASGIENVVGSAFADALTGDEGNNEIYGGVGRDTIRGGGGNDVIYGGTGAGNDTAGAGGLGDVIYGGVGSDTIRGGAGDDVIFGGTGANNDTATTGNDVIFGGVGRDTITGGAGDDVIYGGTGAGNDTAGAGGLGDVIYGGVGSDTIRGGAGDDVIFGGTGAGNDTATAGNDVIFGGIGADTIRGGAGNDVIFGGTGAGNDTATTGNDVIFGGLGRDTITGGVGNDVIFGGTGAGNDTAGGSGLGDVIYGGVGRDTIAGGAGDDVIYGGTGANNDTAGAGALGDVIYGGVGRDTIRGGGGDDVIYGDITYFLTDFGNLASGATLAAGAGNDVIYGGVGSDTIRSGGGDDVIFGGTGAGNDTATAGNDIIFGGTGRDTIRTGGGNDVIYGEEDIDTVEVTAAASLSISGTPQDATITGGGMVKFLFNVEYFGLTGGAGNDTLSAAGFAAPVSLSGGAGNDTLTGGGSDDTLDGGAGDDSLTGGPGADTYAFAGGQQGSDTVTEAAANHGDELNFNGFPAPITLDLGKTTAQVVSPGNLTLTLSNDTGIEDVWGTAYGDVIVGNGRDNVLIGGGGLDSLDGAAGDDTVQGGVTQWVLIDFDTHTGGRDHVYNGDERAAILARLADAFAAFRYAFTTDPADLPPGTPFVTVSVNKPPEVDGVEAVAVGGRASELDWRNTDLAGGIDIDANFLLAAPKAATSANFVALTATIIAHEVGHISGLRHADSFGPIGSGVFASAPLGRVLPPYPGPAGANETRRDLMASPASVGIALSDSLGPVAFGARDAIKLAFADTGTTAAEAAAAHDSPATAQPLALAPLAVPNTLLPPVLNGDGTVAVPSRDYGKHFAVTATSVAGRIDRADRGTGPSEKDYYSFAGAAGQLVTLEAISQGLGGTRDRVDTVLRLLGPGGQPLYFPNGQPVMNDDWLEPTDATILDYTLPATGTYTVVVESYGAEEAGDYELFVYTFATGDQPAPGGGDTLAAGGGTDELVGSSGADTFKVAGAGAVKVSTPANNGRATLDLSGLPAGVTIDLGSTEPQQLGRLVLTLGSAAAVRGFVGTPFADHVTGNELDNTFTAAGEDTFASGGGRDAVTATAAEPGTITATDGLLTGPGFAAHLGEGITRAKLFGSAGEDAFVATGWTGTAALDGAGGKDTYLVNLFGDEGEVSLHDSGADDPREVKDALTVKGARRVVNQVPVGVDEDFVLEAGSVRVSDEQVLYDATIETVEIDGNGGADAAVPGRTPSGPVVTTDIDPALSLGWSEDYLSEGETFSRAGVVTLPDARSVSVLYGLGPNEVPQVINLTGTGAAKSFLLSQVYANNKPDNSPYQVRVTVLDAGGRPLNDPAAAGDPGRVDVFVFNDAPRLSQPGNTTAKLRVGTAFELGTLADRGADGPWTVEVNWGDGSPVVPFTVTAPGPLSAPHTFTTRPGFGVAVVTVKVTEGKAPFASVQRAFSVTVRAEDVISGAGAAVEGQPFALALPNLTQRSANDPLGGITRFRVGWNDGTPDQEFAGAPAGQTLLHTFAADGPLALGVRVSVEFADAPGFFLPAGTMQVAVADAPPAVELLGGGTAVEGGTYTLTFGAVTDPGADTITTFTIHWGDGVRQVVQGRPGGPNNLSRTHAYPDNGAYTITIDATDEDGTHVGVGSKRVDVSDVAPTVALSAAGRVQAGTPLALGLGPVTDPGVVDRVTGYTIDWGHGAPEAFTGSPAGATRSHTYPAPGTFTIRVGLTNKDGTFTPAGTETVVVDPAAAAARLAFGVQPTAVGVTAAIAPGVTVRVETAGGSLLTGSAAPVTLALAANPGGAALGGTLTVNAVNGVATFSSVTLAAVGDGFTLRATSGALTAATSDPFNVLPPTTPGVTVVTNNGAAEVYVVGTAGVDAVVVSPVGLPADGSKGVSLVYSINGQDGGQVVNNQRVSAIRVYLGEGNNTFTMDPRLTLPATVTAGDGNNTITTGGGNDLVVAGNGRNTIDGGPGNDLLIGGRYAPPAGETGRTVLTGGTGNDLLIAGSAVLRVAGDSFRKLADDWARLGPTAAGLATVRNRLTATYAAGRYRLTGGAGVDWFWFNPAAPAGAVESDRLSTEPLR